ncbi:MAG: hypothetical protein NUV56_04855 [Candidatus Uhrbacteria bacterium]|nr:hypothetical protein [Candidatus Uhrbacteria bacterium]
MDVFSVAQSVIQRITDATNSFVDDVRKLSSASHIVAVGIFAFALVRGVGVAIVLQSLERLVDGAIGARGIGVVTDDVQTAWWMTLFFIVMTFTSIVAIRRLSGLSLAIVQRIVAFVQPISLLIVAWPMLNGSLSVVIMLVLIRACIHHYWIVAALSGAIAVVTLLSAHDILVFTATRTMTVGTMLAISGASLYFGLSLATQPYIKKFLN